VTNKLRGSCLWKRLSISTGYSAE